MKQALRGVECHGLDGIYSIGKFSKERSNNIKGKQNRCIRGRDGFAQVVFRNQTTLGGHHHSSNQSPKYGAGSTGGAEGKALSCAVGIIVDAGTSHLFKKPGIKVE